MRAPAASARCAGALNALAALRSAGAQKLLGVLITIGEAVAYVVSGMYGDVRDLGTINAVLIILQARAPHGQGLRRAAQPRRSRGPMRRRAAARRVG